MREIEKGGGGKMLGAGRGPALWGEPSPEVKISAD